jgi:hypothetical protein
MLTLLEAYLTLLLRIFTIVSCTGILGFVLYIEFPLYQAKNDSNTLATALRPCNIYFSVMSVVLIICALFG